MGRDYYTVYSGWYYALIVLTNLYAACYIAFLVLIQNANVPNTVFAPGSTWGTYFSLLYKGVYWLSLFLSCWRILLYVVIQFMILFRKTRWCSIMWLVFIFLITLIDLLVVVCGGKMYGGCNTYGNPWNPCNDPNYCCAVEIYSQPNSGCTNTMACPAGFPTSTSGLYPNVDFLWFFWANLGFFAVDLVFVVFFSSMFYQSPKDTVLDDPLTEKPPLREDDNDDTLAIQRKVRGKLE